MTAPATDDRPGGLLAWQWSLYPRAHTTHPNLAVHALTAPLFVAGTVALLASPWVRSLGLALGGAAAMVAVMLVQMRSHLTEPAAPATFRGPLDVIQRFLAEQWITFPRYILSGEFVRAWRGEPISRR